ncbi:CapA family protein [bacterium]|nr:CapA family protein [bacterium]
MIKISFLGDILCQLPFLKAAQKRGNDFYTAFEGLQPLLQDSDYVVANLETPIAGEEAGYTNDIYSFNTPAEFLDALKRLKIDLYLTANNHCLDRGTKGLKSTLRELDNRQMAHTGTGPTRYHLTKLKDTTIAFLNYTACVNEDKWNLYGHELKDNDLNLLIDIDKYLAYRTEKRKQNIPLYTLRKKLGRAIPKSLQLKLKSALGIKQHPTYDNEPLDAVKGIQLDQVQQNIAQAKSEADLVILLPHCGGQFNTKPGKLSQEIFNTLFNFGADAVIGNHPHTIQETGIHDGKPYAYSLGNVSFSPSYPFLVKESKPEVGIIFHLFIEDKKIVKTTSSMFKSTEGLDHYPILKTIDEQFIGPKN